MNFFKRHSFYIKLYYNKVEITHLDSGETIVKNALENFSTKRFVIANWKIADILIRETINEFEVSKGFFKLSFNALMQQMESFEDGLSDIEKIAMRDLAEVAGAIKVHIKLDTKKISYEEALIRLKNKEFLH